MLEIGTDEVWLTTQDVAKILGVDSSTLRRWRTARPPEGPPYIDISPRHKRYHAHDIEEWLASRRIDPRKAA